MNTIWAMAFVCVSSITQAGNITIANRVPAYCDDILGSPLPVVVIEPQVEEVIKKKAIVKKKPTKRKRCKPGRTRNRQGICGRWK